MNTAQKTLLRTGIEDVKQDSPTIVIDVSGGCIVGVRGNIAVRVIVLDADTEGGDEENVRVIEGNEVYVTEEGVSEKEIDVEGVAAVVAEVDASGE